MKSLTKLLLLLVLAGGIAGCGDDESNPVTTPSTPTITSMSPNSANRGEKNVTSTITGTNLGGVTSVRIGSDITILAFRQVSSTQVQVDFSVPPTVPAGARSVTVNTSAGSATAGSLFNVLANQAPVPSFQIHPFEGGMESDTYTFDASESYDNGGTITQYKWKFDDGEEGQGKTYSRKFPAGTHNATLTVTDNQGISASRTRDFEVAPFQEEVCTEPATNRGLIYGTVIAVEPGNNAIIKFDQKGNCKNSYYHCGDMRDAEVDLGFFGIVMEMADRGDQTFRVYNACPYRWPPKIGQRIFLFYKKCEENHC